MLFIPNRLMDLLVGNREELAALRAANSTLERELTSSRIMTDWMRIRVNQLELERAELLNRAYPGLRVPTAEIARTITKQNGLPDGFDLNSIFEDLSEMKNPPPFPIS